MIRINLLGTPKAKGKRAAAAAASATAMLEAGDSGSPQIKVAIALVLALGFNGWTWHHLDQQAQTIAKNMQVAEQKNRELAEVKAKYLERQREADNYKRRVDVIDQLRANQS